MTLIEDQNLPPATRELYQLAANMTNDAVSTDSHEHSVLSIEKVSTVRCIDRYVWETISDRNALIGDLGQRTDDTKLFRFHTHLADYSQYLCDLLKDSSSKVKTLLSLHPWTTIVTSIDQEFRALAA